MVGIGSELKTKAGPLPVWAWAGLGTVGLAAFLIYRKKQSMNQAAAGTPDTSSTVIGGPSSLVPQAEPMPGTGGDTNIITVNNNDLPSPAQGPCPQGLQRLPNGNCPPAVAKPPTPSLPTVNPGKYPKKVKENSTFGKTFIKIGCWDIKGHYTGKQVAGHVPVYGLSTAAKEFDQGPLATAKGHCVYIPGEFKAYIKG
jgi:hypothetical protein